MLASGAVGSITVQRPLNRILLNAADGIYELGGAEFTRLISVTNASILTSDVDNALILDEQDGTFVYGADGARLFAIPAFFTSLGNDVNFTRGITRDATSENFVVHDWRNAIKGLADLTRLPSP